MRLWQFLAIALVVLPLKAVCAADAPEPLAITPELVAAAEKEGSLTLQYTSPLVTMQGLVAAFNKTYPGVRVHLERKSGSNGAAVLMQELAAGVNRLDVFEGSDLQMNQELANKGAFAALAPKDVELFGAQTRFMAPYLFYPSILRTIIAYNPKQVTDEEAKLLRRWDGILDPVFKGKVGMAEATVGVTTIPWIYVLSTPSLGSEFMQKLKGQNPLIYITTAQTREAIVSGQRGVSWGTDWDAATLIDVSKGAPIRFVYPDPTPEYVVTGWGVLQKAPHPAAARLFFAWQFTREGALAAQEPFSNVRTGRKDVPETRTSLDIVRRQSWYEEPQHIWTPDYSDWVKNGTKYQQTWQQIMRGRAN